MGALPNLPMIEGAIVRTCIERLGKPAHRARSAPGWLLHLPLALGILVTQAQEEILPPLPVCDLNRTAC